MMDDTHAYAVILAGGEGTRFAPYSTPACPKQFLPILDPSRSMLQQTCDRLQSLVPTERVYVATNVRYLELVRKQLPQIPPANILVEPVKKNTAPPMALASHLIGCQDEEALLLFLPADHFVEDVEQACLVFRLALEFASWQEFLITFGVQPTLPSLDYGYLQVASVGEGFKPAPTPRFVRTDSSCFRVERFVEKPSLKKAKEYLANPHFYWNSGMFVWRAKFFRQILEECLPSLARLLESVDPKNSLSIQEYFEKAPSISIDYGVMEKSKEVAMFPFPTGWSDVGTWQGLANLVRHYEFKVPAAVSKYLHLNV